MVKFPDFVEYAEMRRSLDERGLRDLRSLQMCPKLRKLEFLIPSDATTWGPGLTTELNEKFQILKHHLDSLSDSLKVTFRFEKRMNYRDLTPWLYRPSNTDRTRLPEPHHDVVVIIKELEWAVSRKRIILG
jgi:hypothetical protein